MIPYGRQHITAEDIVAVCNTLKSDWLTQGPEVSKFEYLFSEYCSAEYVVAVNSATSALHIACLALGLTERDWLWTSPNTFVASANCGRLCGAQIDFVDIDPVSYNMCSVKLEEKLKLAAESGRLPKIVIPVHFAGQSCDMLAISKLSKKYGFKIIEDASHAVGSKYLDQPVGRAKYSDVVVFSLHPVKIITSAEGGIALTNNPEIAQKMQLYRSHGVSRPDHLVERGEPWLYEQSCLGLNYRITDILCSLGISQMKRLDDYVNKRHEVAAIYNQAFSSNSNIKCPKQLGHSRSSYHLYPIQVHAKSRKEIFNELRSEGVGVNVHYIPVHTQPYYQQFGFCEGDFPNAELYYSQAISIPLYPQLESKDQQFIIDKLNKLTTNSGSPQ
jgi:UDP-4-amino-4,6-dideoxy-N-acetyl-beta-L-altrosamine transaminase